MILLFKASNQVAAIGEASFVTNEVQIIICKKEKVLHLTKAYEFDVLFAGSTVELVEASGKIGVTHVTHFRKLGNPKTLMAMGINIF